MKPFKDLPAKEQGIDTSREFTVVESNSYFAEGDILVLDRDDNSLNPWFKRKNDKKRGVAFWSRLTYAPTQPEEEPMPTFKDLPAKEQGIDTSKEFIVVDGKGHGRFNKGDILTLIDDDGSNMVMFRRKSDGVEATCYWGRLAYAPTQPKEQSETTSYADKLYWETENPLLFDDSKNIKLAKIIEWLYVNDGGYPNKIKWREALIKMLKEVI